MKPISGHETPRRATRDSFIEPGGEWVAGLHITVIYVQVLLFRLIGVGASDLMGPRRADDAIRVLTRMAGALAGHRHAHLRKAWDGDQYDPDTGEPLPTSRRLRLARGNVLAALRCRLDDAADQAWRPVDALLSSWHGSNLATFLPVTVTAGVILSYGGFYGVITNAENLGVIAAAPYAAIKGLRKYRQISTPKRPEEKASSADGSHDC